MIWLNIITKKNDPTDIYKPVLDYAVEFGLKKFPTNVEIINLLIDSKKNDFWTREIINSYDLYTFYSK